LYVGRGLNVFAMQDLGVSETFARDLLDYSKTLHKLLKFRRVEKLLLLSLLLLLLLSSLSLLAVNYKERKRSSNCV
jgi:hypothetical protein